MKRPWLVRVLAVVGAVAIVAAVAGGALIYILVGRGFSARDDPSAAETMLARRMRSLSAGAEVRALKIPFPVTPQTISEAAAHWADHCAICHGNDGRGDTAIGRNLYPRAPDMRAEPTQSLSDGELYSIIENGVRLTGMPAWGDGRPDHGDSWSLVAFIRHLPQQTDEELARMKQLNPRSVHEAREEKDEEEFLNGPSGEEHEHHHGGGH